MQDQHKTRRISKRFTVDEATAMIPLISSIASDIRGIFKDVTGRRSDLHRLLRTRNQSVGVEYDDEVAESRADLQAEYDQIWQYREELEALGVLLRQPEEGLIEFPTLVLGREAFLCWKIGEKRITQWRDAATPNSPKQLLPSLEKA